MIYNYVQVNDNNTISKNVNRNNIKKIKSKIKTMSSKYNNVIYSEKSSTSL